MAKATNKSELIESANEGFRKMWQIIEAIPNDRQEQGFCFDVEALLKKDGAHHWRRDKNIRDVLVHLYEWHMLVINWVTGNSGGEALPFLPKPYTWTNYQGMNEEFFVKHQSTSFLDAKSMVQGSHNRVLDLINGFTDQELFTKKYFSWTGTTSLAQYFHSATTAHYDWAQKKLKAHQKALNSEPING